GRGASAVGVAALASLMGADAVRAAGDPPPPRPAAPAKSLLPHFAPKARRVIYLFQSGGPSHLELFDYKPALKDLHGKELPNSIRMGQRLTGMTSGQKSFPVIA